MRTFVLSALALASVVCAQQPANEMSPTAGGTVTGPLHGPDCQTVRAPFNVTATCGLNDIRILGIANTEYTVAGNTSRKWFFSGTNGGSVGPQKVYVYDADRANNPIAATARNMNQHPGMISAFWGHRDGEGYTYIDTTTATVKSVVLFGDEGRNIHVLNAMTETWLGSFNLATYSTATTRGVACRPKNAFADQQIYVYVCDFSNLIEEWELDLATGAATRTANVGIPNPGAGYGLSCFEYNGKWYLGHHGQIANTCTAAGAGLVKITIMDLTAGNYGTVVWSRTCDTSIPGAAPNVAGGIAGGLQHAWINGQPVLAGLQQATADTAGFVSYGGFGVNGAADCGSQILSVNGAPTAGAISGASLLGTPPASICILALAGPALAGLPFAPFNPACTLDTFPIALTIGFPPANPNGDTAISFLVPATFSGDLGYDSVCFNGAWTSSNPVTVHVTAAPF